MNFSLKQRVGALLIDAPQYLYLLLRRRLNGGPAWLQVRNRNEEIEVSDKHFGIKCDWQWTSDLHLPKVFPQFGQWLFRKALSAYSFSLESTKPSQELPVQVSFIIGHRGSSRSDLLLKTIASIAAQKHCYFECIVVEQDNTPIVRDLLPKWVKYVFTPLDDSAMPYSRSWAFNVGAKHASSNCLIFHDNDLLIPDNYGMETLKMVGRGFDFVNLKRFIFYLTEAATDDLLSRNNVDSKLSVESIMQNAEGGGSVGANKKAYLEIGGFDERFVGWGGEDNEFWERAQTRRVWPYAYLPLIHLWHGAQTEKLNIEASNTKALYNKLSKQSPEQRIAHLTNQGSISCAE